MIIKKYIQLLDSKSQIVIKNVLYSSLIKGINIGMNFLTVPLILSFLDTTRYGIWLTISAVLSWFSLFDLGLGNGLRNKLTIALAEGNYKDAKIYISTTYVLLSGVFGILLAIFIIINPFIDWLVVFNAPLSLSNEIKFAAFICISCIFFQLVFRLINTVLLSLQKAAIADLVNTIVQGITFVGLLLLKYYHLHSLKSITLIFAIIPVVVFLVVNIYLFTTSLNHISPSFKYFKKEYIKNLLNLGVSFFLIQIAALVLYATDNFIITQLFSPADVSIYNVAYKYFSITNLALTIVLPSFWSMTTKAFAEKDMEWIKKSMNKLLLIWIGLGFVAGGQLLVSQFVYDLWIGEQIQIPFTLSVFMLLYYLVFNLAGIMSNFLNALGKTRIQLYYASFAMIINFPIAYFLTKICSLGVIGVPIATTIVMFLAGFLCFIQYQKIINNKAEGIWNK